MNCIARNSSLALALLASLTALASAAARADTQVAPTLRLEWATDREGIANVQYGAVPDQWGYDLGLVLNYEHNPLFTYRQNTLNTLERDQILVADRVTADALLSIALFNWVELGVDVPVVLDQGGVNKIGTTGLGDILVDPKVRILRQKDGAPIDVAALIDFSLPTGQFLDYAGETGVTFTPGIAISRDFGPLRMSANVGHRFRQTSAVAGLTAGNELIYRLGVGVPVWSPTRDNPVEIDVALAGGAATDNLFRGTTGPLVNNADESEPDRNPLEALAEIKAQIIPGLEAFVGGGVGLAAGYGVPDFRVLLGARFSDRPEYDEDGDGLTGKADRCPKIAGPKENQGCPDTDKDGDGIIDRLDKCPSEPEDKDGFQDEDGCPDLDNDKDGVLDADDKCPNVAGPKENHGCPDTDKDGDGIIDRLDKCPNEPEDKDGFQDEDGCPDLDNDGDGFPDKDDACPNEAGIKQNKGCPDKDRDHDGVVDRLDNCPDEPGTADNGGCPTKQLVVITDAKLEIKDKVFFDTDKDVIQAKSFPLLDNVAAVMKAHPEIKKIQVEGHTDNVGNADHNKDLSDRRAKSVMKYLIDKGGVDAARLTALGFGMDKPIASNDTADGKAQNRRVEFVIVDNAP
ncbi:MAG TPA: OmpA family protein [Myxococcota bacterium]